MEVGLGGSQPQPAAASTPHTTRALQVQRIGSSPRMGSAEAPEPLPLVCQRISLSPQPTPLGPSPLPLSSVQRMGSSPRMGSAEAPEPLPLVCQRISLSPQPTPLGPSPLPLSMRRIGSSPRMGSAAAPVPLPLVCQRMSLLLQPSPLGPLPLPPRAEHAYVWGGEAAAAATTTPFPSLAAAKRPGARSKPARNGGVTGIDQRRPQETDGVVPG